MRVLRCLLKAVGFAALGAASAAFLLLLAMKAFLPEPRGENWGAAPAWFGLLSCGGVLGAIVGLVAASASIARTNGEPWRPAVRLGVILGSAAGLISAPFFPDYYEIWLRLLLATFLASTGGAAGGLLAAAVSPLLSRRAGKLDRGSRHDESRPRPSRRRRS